MAEGPRPLPASVELESILRASQVISSELDLDVLVRQLMKVVLETCGAARSALFLDKGGALFARVVGRLDGEVQVDVDERALDALDAELCTSLVRIVARTGESLAVDDATRELRFREDAYVTAHEVRALAAVPLGCRGERIGVLYVENAKVRGAFTTERVQALQLLASQGAISLKNASLFSDVQAAKASVERFNQELEAKFCERTAALEKVQERVVMLERSSTEVRMAGGFAHEMRNALFAATTYLSRGFGKSLRDGNTGTLPKRSVEAVQEILAVVHAQDLPTDVRAKVAAAGAEVLKLQSVLEQVLTGTGRAIERSLEITRHISAYSRVGQEATVDARCLLAPAARTAVDDLAQRLRAARIEVQLDVDDALPFPLSPRDAASVLSNLLTNAIDAIEEQPPEHPRRIHVHARVDGHDVVLRVQDTGAGIAPEHRRRIFDAFFSTKPSKGTGLGLAMLQKIVHTYEGKVDVDSDLGLGTTFCVRVPLRQNEQRVLEQE